ncbi:hypothetical protein HDU93_006880, partial [Gonapodya sp. JEL0774]
DREKEVVALQAQLAIEKDAIAHSELLFTEAQEKLMTLERDSERRSTEMTKNAEAVALEIGEKWKSEIESVTRSADRKVQSLRSELIAERKKYEMVKSDAASMSKTMQTQIKALESKMIEKEQQLESGLHTILESGVKLTELASELQHAETDSKAQVVRICELEALLSEAQLEASTSRSRIGDLEVALQDELNRSNNAKSRQLELEQQLAITQGNLNTAFNIVRSIEIVLDDQEGYTDEMTSSSIRDDADHHLAITDRLRNVIERARSTDDRVTHLQGELASVTSELSDSKDLTSRLEATISELKMNLST